MYIRTNVVCFILHVGFCRSNILISSDFQCGFIITRVWGAGDQETAALGKLSHPSQPPRGGARPCPGWGPLGGTRRQSGGDKGRSLSCGFRGKERTRQVMGLRTGLREPCLRAPGCPGCGAPALGGGSPAEGVLGRGSGSVGLHILQLINFFFFLAFCSMIINRGIDSYNCQHS